VFLADRNRSFVAVFTAALEKRISETRHIRPKMGGDRSLGHQDRMVGYTLKGFLMGRFTHTYKIWSCKFCADIP
jgi:hypothetical protein